VVLVSLIARKIMFMMKHVEIDFIPVSLIARKVK